MAIRKTKPSNVNIDKMFNDVETDEQIENEKIESDEYLKTIKESTSMLKNHSEYLVECVETEKKAAKALEAAANSCDNAVTGISKAIVNAQQKTVFKAAIIPEHLAQLKKLNDDFLAKEGQQLADHRAKQEKMLREHEERMEKILSQNEGFWVSNFWAKVLGVVLLAYTIICFLYVFCKT